MGYKITLPECQDYLSSQLLTYIGNKRRLLGHIGAALDVVKTRLEKERLSIFDAFAGSGVVSRYLKAHAQHLISNDFESFAAVVGRCYLRNRSSVDFTSLRACITEINSEVDSTRLDTGFIQELYAPRDELAIQPEDRVFYTRDNARRLDDYRRRIDKAPEQYRDILLGPLLSEASIHANTAGVFKGFYKDRRSGIGRFGGTNSDALSRIKGRIVLEPPLLSRFECDIEVHQEDTNTLAPQLKELDIAYLDPPYNQHPYGSNYFMLNLLVQYERPTSISRVSGIPTDWKRSDYNVRAKCLPRLRDLIASIDAPFILVSFNNEGYVGPKEMRDCLSSFGHVGVVEIPYNTFRGSRNLRNRSIHVTEQLFLLERS